jgi:hypothetical protein
MRPTNAILSAVGQTICRVSRSKGTSHGVRPGSPPDIGAATTLAEQCPTGGYLEVHPIFDVSSMTS